MRLQTQGTKTVYLDKAYQSANQSYQTSKASIRDKPRCFWCSLLMISNSLLLLLIFTYFCSGKPQLHVLTPPQKLGKNSKMIASNVKPVVLSSLLTKTRSYITWNYVLNGTCFFIASLSGLVGFVLLFTTYPPNSAMSFFNNTLKQNRLRSA